MEHHDRKARRTKFALAGVGVLTAAALTAGAIAAVSVLGGDDKSPKAAASSPVASPSAPATSAHLTPETAQKFKLDVPTGQKDGVSTGFRDTSFGAVSAAVYFWEELAFLDDQKARQQLEAMVSPDAAGLVDEQVSEVRKLRETANLPPSGGTPAGITFTTTVNAVRFRPLPNDSKVFEVWLAYDRYATKSDGGPDNNPLKGQMDELMMKWQNGAWKITNEPRYWSKRTFPASYFPDSRPALKDGWVQVRHAD
ncbi:hypothetical protein [Streptomyces violascens]|uniref:Integral membrane protein n=1 Tax=Streptomyces violascens TaxID=67381 RepID=A0ABQ3QL79_9ACTN|nr:hypothetical protein [Streptomyces violascens]GGU44643.1 hypothetical protein GCM10010289_76540 [Streptomyces violascens]GHI38025.1 hypothetical protein Sviol_24330 [Streptomyces violascens]